MSPELRSILIGTGGLWLAAGFALVLSLRRRSTGMTAVARRAMWSALAATGVQGGHFAEEWRTDFFREFPRQLGLAPWPADFFWWFNVIWLAVWIVSAIGVSRGARIAYFPLWFLALTGMLNAVVHPLLALIAGGYFPGLWTSPAVGVFGFMLWRALHRATEPIAA
jgi:hypothetical protein